MGRLVPADELPDAFLDADGGPVAELALGPAQIGGREMHVAGLVGRGLHDGLPTERAANQGEQPVESHPVAPTDVERLAPPCPALGPIQRRHGAVHRVTNIGIVALARPVAVPPRSEEHTSELQSRLHLVCRLLLEKKKTSSY